MVVISKVVGLVREFLFGFPMPLRVCFWASPKSPERVNVLDLLISIWHFPPLMWGKPNRFGTKEGYEYI